MMQDRFPIQPPANILDREISLFKYAKDIHNPQQLKITDFLDNVKNGLYKDCVIKARELHQISEESFKKFKSAKVPGVTLSANCLHRVTSVTNLNKLVYHTGLLQIDIDKKPNENENISLDQIKGIIKADKHTLFSFVSISGNGIKAAIRINPDCHLDYENWKKYYYQQIKYYYKGLNIEIDTSCSDVFRLCFIGYDPDLYINNDAVQFEFQELQQEFKVEVSTKLQKPQTNSNTTDIQIFGLSRNAERLLKNAKQIISASSDGNRHQSRLKAGNLLGGGIAGGLFTQKQAICEIQSVVSSNTTLKLDKAMKSIYESLEHGKFEPITDEMMEKKFQDYLEQRNLDSQKSLFKCFESVNKETGEVIDSSINIDFVWKCLENDEKGDAELIAEIFKNSKMFSHDEVEWFSYINGIWIKDNKKQTRKEVNQKLIDIYGTLHSPLKVQLKDLKHNEIENDLVNDKKDSPKNKEQESLESKIKSVQYRIKKLNTKNRINNVLDLANSYLSCTSNEFDSNKYLLNLKNGTYDLKNMVFRSHNHLDKLRLCSGAYYIQDAGCSEWLKFLNTIFNGNTELIEFIQRLCGVWLSGISDFQHIVFAYGSGANGKSTFFNALQLLLNGSDNDDNKISKGYFSRFKIETLLYSKSKNTATDDYWLAQLQGIRLAVASEIPKDSTLNESLIKDLTGGETINARHPYGRPFSFNPTHKTVIFGNSKPLIRDISEGLWRRMLLVPFEVTIPEEKRIPQSEFEIKFKKELSGILNWCLEGWKNYISEGIKIPEIVKIATKEYQNESNLLSEFFEDIKDKFNIKPQDKILKIKADNFFKCFIEWCNEDSFERENEFKNVKSFNRSIRELGFEVKPYTGGKSYIFGIAENQKLV
ncbi:MAG: phage/plasmid primase, P4 family [Candidatus Kapabacteria bacterium]|nr:phage/plasmid primase, P4 family [Candidatus Kapabacteria bacterium]